MFPIVAKKELNSSVTMMTILAPFVAKKAQAGQFIIFRVDEYSERIPLTIADYDREAGTVTIIFQKVGYSTELLGSKEVGDSIRDFVGPLGIATDYTGMKRVAVVGGGNVAMDAARCAKRMGAKVYIIYRRSEAEMPARKEEIHHAKEEGIEFLFLHNPVQILGDENKQVTGIECVKMELGEPDDSGRRRPVPIEGSNFVIDVDTVIMALGTSPNPLIRSTTAGLETNKKGCLVVNEETNQTTRDHVYAGGDAVTGAATVILAMGAGKKAAAAIDAELSNR